MAQRRREREEDDAPSEPGLERCETAAGQPAWRWGPDGYPYGYDPDGVGTLEAVAKQQAEDYGRSWKELQGDADGKEDE
jgi:hypothetical protein